MFRNYLKIAYRSLLSSKLSSVINILGLSIGIGVSLLLLLFVRNELSFDQFNEKKDRLYRGWTKEQIGADRTHFSTITPFPFGPTLKDNFPEVESSSIFLGLDWKAIQEDKLLDVSVHMVSPQFLDMFSFDRLEGQFENILQDPTDVVLTERAATKHFGNDSPIGKPLTFKLEDGDRTFTVKGIVKDPPSNSSLTFQYLISDLNKANFYPANVIDNWFVILGETYVLLREGAELKSLESKFPLLMQQVVGESNPESNYKIGLQPLPDLHTNLEFPVGIAPVTDARYSYILAGMAALILLIACINFVTLSIGKSVGRAKEVGLRKVVGAQRIQLIQQHLSETVVIVFIALLVGLLIAYFSLSYFNELSGRNLQFSFSPFLVGTSVGLIVLIGLMAGSYPALVISAFEPVSILKGNFQGVNTKNKLRRVLLGIQFVFSLALIAGSLIMSEQLTFLQEKNLGLDKEQLMIVPLNVTGGRFSQRITLGMEKSELFISQLSRNASVVGVAAAAQDIGNSWMRLGFTTFDKQYKEFNLNVVSPEYIRVMRMTMAQGRDFQRENLSDFRRAVIVNESFLKEFNLPDPLGKKIPGPNFEDHEIIGVVKDFNFQSLHGMIKPIVIVLDFAVVSGGFENINISSSPNPKLAIRYQANKTNEVLEAVRNSWEMISGNEDLNYSFVDEKLAGLYRSEENLRKIVTGATIISILLGSLGLFAFASLSITNKLKELSIRKILGATEGGLFFLVSREYVFLILFSLIFSIPFTWYYMDQWLATFAYRIAINPIYFLLTGVFSIAIALLTISYHAWTAARTQPADHLRVE